MNNLFSYSFLLIIVLIIVVSCMCSISSYSNFNIDENDIYISEDGFVWPLPGLYRISSYFGYRNSPTNYASSFHSGLDIPASEGTYFLACISGTVTYTGFSGSGGYTIKLENDDTLVTYCHVSPNFLVNVGDYIEKGTVLGQVRTFSCL